MQVLKISKNLHFWDILLQQFLPNIRIFPKISKECVFCSVLAVVPNQNDTQFSIKIYVKEDLIEYLETESHIKGSSKYSILF